MSRKWLFALSFAYLIIVVSAALLVGTQNKKLVLTLPESDALLLAGVIAGGIAIAGIEIWILRQNQKHLLAEKRQLDEVIASQKETIQEQKSAVGEQQEFRRALNHELRNPITAISTGLERLSDEYDNSTVARLKTDVERVSGLLETVNALARLETEPIEHTPVQLDEIMQQAVEIIKATPQVGDRKLTMDLPPGPFPLPPVLGDDDLLFIVLHNLLENAVKFTPENGEAVIRAFEDNDTVVLQVSDNGLGIRKEDLANVWKPFFRGQDAKDGKIAGSGLGLFQVHKIVARHGGQVSIRSKVGEGTVVTIRLPVGNITEP